MEGLSYSFAIAAALIFLSTAIQAFEIRFRGLITGTLVAAACAVLADGLIAPVASDHDLLAWLRLGDPSRIAQQRSKLDLTATQSDEYNVQASATPSMNVDRASVGNESSTPLQRIDLATAVYDIAAHTVYLPSGERLEAHSGLGAMLDDPRFVHEPMRGATPPSTYDLTLREKPFHGIRALRLVPVGDANIFGRKGLLAHTYMLGPKGDSNGCVVFKDYSAFLHAFEAGEVKRLLVVAHLD
jgi:Protein of unknown function (DUF2778)